MAFPHTLPWTAHRFKSATIPNFNHSYGAMKLPFTYHIHDARMKIRRKAVSVRSNNVFIASPKNTTSLHACGGTLSLTTNSSKYSAGCTPLKIITGITPDISEYLDFHIYSWVFYKSNAGLGPSQLGCWLGVSHRRGPLMTYWILTSHGDIISCNSVQRVTNVE